MAFNLDGVAAQPTAPGQTERRQADVRQGRWMYELEHALLLGGARKPAAPERAAAAPRAAGEAAGPRADMAGRDRPAQVPQQAPVTAPAAARAAQPALAAGPSEAGAAAGKPAAPASADTGPQRPSLHGVVTVGVAGAAAPLPWAPDTQPAAHRWAGVTPAPTGMALAGARLAGAPAAAGEEPAGTLPPPKATAGAPGLPRLAPAAGREAPLAREELADGEPAPPAAPPEAALTQDYATRLLHLYQGADGVQAWLRDGDVSPAQALGLAQAMAGELAGAGARLAALTVNGRRLPLAARGAHDGFTDSASEAAAPGGAAPQSIIHTKGVVQ